MIAGYREIEFRETRIIRITYPKQAGRLRRPLLAGDFAEFLLNGAVDPHLGGRICCLVPGFLFPFDRPADDLPPKHAASFFWLFNPSVRFSIFAQIN